MTKLDDLEHAIISQGFDFLRWADWHPEHPPPQDWTKLHLQGFPAARHWVHHSVTPASASPVQAARTINQIGIQRFGKMSYPFLIHASGTIIQGCYPYIGAHTLNYNSTSLAGCNIGDYQAFRPPQRMVDANVALIRALRATGHYSTRDATPVYGHQQSTSASTACPGQYLMAWLPHIRRVGNLPIPTPPPTTQPLGDEMFSYDGPHPESPTTKILVVVSGGKQVRVTGQNLGDRMRNLDSYIGEVGVDEMTRFEAAWGKVIL